KSLHQNCRSFIKIFKNECTGIHTRHASERRVRHYPCTTFRNEIKMIAWSAKRTEKELIGGNDRCAQQSKRNSSMGSNITGLPDNMLMAMAKVYNFKDCVATWNRVTRIDEGMFCYRGPKKESSCNCIIGFCWKSPRIACMCRGVMTESNTIPKSISAFGIYPWANASDTHSRVVRMTEQQPRRSAFIAPALADYRV
ncbi:unnamed protein product, partial [Trichogramma brassicae]